MAQSIIAIFLASLIGWAPQEETARPNKTMAQPMGVASEQTEPADEKFNVIGYLPEYRIATIKSEAIEPITDVIFFGLEPDAKGEFSELDATTLKKLEELKNLTQCRLLVTVGGWERSDGFSAFSQNDDDRKALIEKLFDFCQRHDFDGIDYDWEHPHGADELAAYGRLVAESAETFHEAGLLVTVAQAGWQDLGKQVYESVDRIHLMAYDHEFPQSTLAKSKADVERLIEWGCPPEKIALGLPFYGRNKHGNARTYAELLAGVVNRNETVDPSNDLLEGYAFNGAANLESKVELAQDLNLAGVMIWELGQDAESNASLLRVIDQKLRTTKASPSK